MSKSVLRWSFVCLALTTLAGCAGPGRGSRFVPDGRIEQRIGDGSFVRTLDARPQVTLDVVNRTGSVRVRPGRTREVRISGAITVEWNRGRFPRNADEWIRRIEANPPIEVRGNVIRIGQTGAGRVPPGIVIRYEIEAPPNTILRLQTGTGRIVVD